MTLPTLIPMIVQLFSKSDSFIWIEKCCGEKLKKVLTIVRKILLIIMWGGALLFLLITLQVSAEIRLPDALATPAEQWKIFGIAIMSVVCMSAVNWINFAMCSTWEFIRNLSEMARGITKYQNSVTGLPQNTDLTLVVAYIFISVWKIGITILVYTMNLRFAIKDTNLLNLVVLDCEYDNLGFMSDQDRVLNNL